MILCCKDIIEDWKIRVCDKKNPVSLDPENRFMEKLTKNNYSHYVFMMPLKDLKITSIIMNQGIERTQLS